MNMKIKKKEIKKIEEKINEEYIKENELVTKRRQFKNAINIYYIKY